jgi:hypothetical protein
VTVEFELRCALPERLADCVHDELAFFVAHRSALILYGALGGVYVEDIGDDPDRADEWDAGEETWLDRARSAYPTLITRGGGLPVRLSRQQRGWTAAPEPELPRDMLSALASFGTDPVLWTALSKPRRFANDLDLAAALDNAPWWLAHGYKEPFLVIGTREPIESIARALDAAVDPSPFRPHRVRAHAKGLRR